MIRVGAAVNAVAPGAAATWRLFRRLQSKRARAAFLRLEWRRVLGKQYRLPESTRPNAQILFVCHGNIMRSALADAALRHAVAGSNFRVASAGTDPTDGEPPDPRTLEYAGAAGLDLSAHRACRLNLELARASDLVFALDRRIESEIVGLDRSLEERTFLLGGITASGAYLGRDIDDPFTFSPEKTIRAFDQVMSSVQVVAARLATLARPSK